MSHLHKLVQAARISADAKDTQQVKKYLDQINEFATNLDDQEEARKRSEERASKAASTASKSSSTGGGASGSHSDDPQKK